MTPGARPLILASASPRRRELLGELGVPFSVVVAGVEEHEEPSTDPRVMVAHNAARALRDFEKGVRRNFGTQG